MKRKSRKANGRAKDNGHSNSKPQERMLDAMNQVWLAGLGALSKAREGAPQMLDELVAEGVRVQADTRGAAEKALGGLLNDVKATIDSRVSQVRGQASEALDNLEEIFQTRVRRALTQLGVPSAEDVEALSRRVDALNVSINKLGRKGKTTAARGHSARKTASSARATAS
jgi:poly(hydroxyalkanoate) granule-associated protein